MKIIEEYRNLTEEIAVIDSQITSKQREIQQLKDTYKPLEIKAVCYSEVTSKAGYHPKDLLDVTDEINELVEEVKELKSLKIELHEQRHKLEEVIDGFGDKKKKVVMMRIKGMTISEIADEMNYCERHVWRIMVGIK